jgi:hypothetical protein
MFGRHVYIGIYGDNPFSEISAEIDFTRSILTFGTIIFRYSNVLAYLDSLKQFKYQTLAIPPTMRWKDSVPPNPPQGLLIRKLTSDSWQLVWFNPEPASDGQKPDYYVIYRSEQGEFVDINNPRNILAIVPTASSVNIYTDKIPDTTKIYAYVVTSLDRLKNESQPSNVVITSVGLESILTDFNLSPGYPNPFNSVINFSYSVPSGSFVDIRIYDLLGREVKKIVSGFHFNGRYQFYWDGTDNNGVEVASGFYVCRMNAFKNGKVIFSNSQKISFLK